MTSARHRQTSSTAPRRLVRFVKPAAATVVTACVVLVAVGDRGTGGPVQAADAIAGSAATSAAAAPTVTPAPHTSVLRADRSQRVSRSARRVVLVPKPRVTGHEFMVASLNLWPAPREHGRPLAVLKKGGKVAVTGKRRSSFAEILYAGQVRWVKQAYLADRMPKPRVSAPVAAKTSASAPVSAPAASSGGISTAPCPDGSGTEAGLTTSAVTLFRSVCNAFPALSSYGGYDAHGEHSSGKAIDFMVSSSSLGQAVADWARAHASELNLYDVIWAQHIWTPVRASEGWRAMPDRGSATANHYDHVHVSVN